MAILLARTADRLYWGARYVERAEDTARIVRAYHEFVVDFSSIEVVSWQPLAALSGSLTDVPLSDDDPLGERATLHMLLVDREFSGSISHSVDAARENLRTTREVMPREAWQAINQLALYVSSTATGAVDRQLRDRFLLRVVEVSRRLDGILESTMSRSNAYRMLRLGRLIERADMTTRVLGVAAASVLALEGADRSDLINDEVRWMNVLRSVSALQMYQRAVRGPIDGVTVVRFLLSQASFPRSVQACLDDIRSVLLGLPTPQPVLAELDATQAVLAEVDPTTVGARLDHAMDRVQRAIGGLDAAVHERYVASVL